MSAKRKAAELEKLSERLEQELLAENRAEKRRKMDAYNLKRRLQRQAQNTTTFRAYTTTGLLQRTSKPSASPSPAGQKNNADKRSSSVSDGIECLPVPMPYGTNSVSVQEMVDEAFATLDKPASDRPSQEWNERRKKDEARWEEVRPRIFTSMLKNESPKNAMRAKCSICDSHLAVIRCIDGCGDLCVRCDAVKHKFQANHLRYTWALGYKTPLLPCQTLERQENGLWVMCSDERAIPIKMDEKCRKCNSDNVTGVIDTSCIFVFVRGRRNAFLPALACQSTTCSHISKVEIEDLIASNYFPGSPNIRNGCYIYDVEVLNNFHQLKMACPGLSAKSFRTSLERLSKGFGVCEPKVCPSSFKNAMEEWRRCSFEFAKLGERMESGKDLLLSCPCCYKQCHVVHLDGNKKCSRWLSNSKSVRQSYMEGTFLYPDEDVAEFDKNILALKQRASSKESQTSCKASEWKAARSECPSFSKLDETGIFIAACRHECILGGINMKRGEVYSYPLFVQDRLGQRLIINFICGDVMCQYWPFVENIVQRLKAALRENDNHVLKSVLQVVKMVPVLSIWHAEGHSRDCRLVWSGKFVQGLGTSTEEHAELVFSVLSKLGQTTKRMDKAARNEMLTEFALYWNERKHETLPKSLAGKYDMAFKLLPSLQDELHRSGFTAEQLREERQSMRDKADGNLANPTPAPSQRDMATVRDCYCILSDGDEDGVTGPSLELSHIGPVLKFLRHTRRCVVDGVASSEIQRLKREISVVAGNLIYFNFLDYFAGTR